MTIEELAKKHKLRTEKLGDEVIIPGRLGHLFMYDENESLIGALYSAGDVTGKGWNQRRKEWKAVGADIAQDGDTEGVITFPASRLDLLKLSINLVKARRKKVISPETKARLIATLAKSRKKLKKAV